ncbi:hypothetical protein H6770_05485 [Candidatus Peribacteria bacterium]|nr:hypothetical protein [Candidatus Peribacteria bacterium]
MINTIYEFLSWLLFATKFQQEVLVIRDANGDFKELEVKGSRPGTRGRDFIFYVLVLFLLLVTAVVCAFFAYIEQETYKRIAYVIGAIVSACLGLAHHKAAIPIAPHQYFWVQRFGQNVLYTNTLVGALFIKKIIRAIGNDFSVVFDGDVSKQNPSPIPVRISHGPKPKVQLSDTEQVNGMNSTDEALQISVTLRLPFQDRRDPKKTFIPTIEARLLDNLSRHSASTLAKADEARYKAVEAMLPPLIAQGLDAAVNSLVTKGIYLDEIIKNKDLVSGPLFVALEKLLLVEGIQIVNVQIGGISPSRYTKAIDELSLADVEAKRDMEIAEKRANLKVFQERQRDRSVEAEQMTDGKIADRQKVLEGKLVEVAAARAQVDLQKRLADIEVALRDGTFDATLIDQFMKDNGISNAGNLILLIRQLGLQDVALAVAKACGISDELLTQIMDTPLVRKVGTQLEGEDMPSKRAKTLSSVETES